MDLKSSFFDQTKQISRIPYEELDASRRISTKLLTLFPASSTRPIVIVCIGTDRSTGDSLGPLVGTLLKEKAASSSSFFIYGTLEEPIHAINLEEQLSKIKANHFNPFIVGVDACLGRLKSIGIVQIGEGPVRPGAGVNKELPSVGDAHITGIVNVSGFMEFMVLQNTRLNLVLNMAKTIANGIYYAGCTSKPPFTSFNWTFEEEKTL
jgi:putative sporulation protein YyaC